jgi:hypothetical protein
VRDWLRVDAAFTNLPRDKPGNPLRDVHDKQEVVNVPGPNGLNEMKRDR